MPYASNDDLSIPVDTTRNVEAFLEKTAIAYRQNLALFLENGWYAIAVFSKNALTLRVDGCIHVSTGEAKIKSSFHPASLAVRSRLFLRDISRKSVATKMLLDWPNLCSE